MAYDKRDFEELISKKCNNTALEGVIAMLFLFALCGLFLYFGFLMMFIPLILMGLGFVGFAYYIIKKNRGDFKGGEFWVRLIQSKPDSIVWIKPITVKHTVGFVLTLYKERKFQLLTNDNIKVTITCASDKDSLIFLQGVVSCMPHAHIGYSEHIARVYSSNPNEFIAKLKEEGFYLPVSQVISER